MPRQCPRRGPCGVVGAARPESHGRKRGGDIPRVKAGGGHRRRWARTPGAEKPDVSTRGQRK